MKPSYIKIENYKGLRDLELQLSSFICLIGENNAGKSSVLQAFAQFFSGSQIPRSYFFNDTLPVRIEVAFTGIEPSDLDVLAEEHRSKLAGIVRGGHLRLVRIYSPEGGRGALKYRSREPNEERFTAPKIDELMSGRRAGPAFVEAVSERFPELSAVIASSMNQTQMREKITQLADEYPDERKVWVDLDLPTGIDKSIGPFLPEPIYIAAVKDFRDDVKTSESSTFGKVLGILLDAIAPLLGEEKALFEKLNSKLNRQVGDGGGVLDERLRPVKDIEDAITGYVQESFKNVNLRIEIPPPEIKTILSSAAIYADDGVDGNLETKGDGLKRAVVFAILRAYVELKRRGTVPAEVRNGAHYVLLFEEPELYLYPAAQQVLFGALSAFSENHMVMVTTHSPSFFGPRATTNFVKIRKRVDAAVAAKPFAVVHPIDVTDTSARDQFQLICYENNNIAFFAETVILVEGDSDLIVFPHMARMLNSSWVSDGSSARFCRIGGKSNFRRYREFFERFGTRVIFITDLDFLLGSEFSQCSFSAPIIACHSQLLAAVDRVVASDVGAARAGAAAVRAAQDSGDIVGKWRHAVQMHDEFKSRTKTFEELAEAVDAFFAWERYSARKMALKSSMDPELVAKKRELLRLLRGAGVYVLARGDIEDYYPATVRGAGKLEMAQSFCSIVREKNELLALCDGDHLDERGEAVSEFVAIFGA